MGSLFGLFLSVTSEFQLTAMACRQMLNLTITTQGRPGEQGHEAVAAESQDVQDGRADSSLPATWQGQFRSHRDLRKNRLWERGIWLFF